MLPLLAEGPPRHSSETSLVQSKLTVKHSDHGCELVLEAREKICPAQGVSGVFQCLKHPQCLAELNWYAPRNRIIVHAAHDAAAGTAAHLPVSMMSSGERSELSQDVPRFR